MDLVQGAQAFQILARHLKETGEGGLRRDLQAAIKDAALPASDMIAFLPHLESYMPNRYAAVLSRDLRVTTHKNTSISSPGVTLFARAPTVGRGGRKIRQREAGTITHPLFGDKERWYVQTRGMSPGFFADPAERAAPHVRDKILEAIHRVENMALGRP